MTCLVVGASGATGRLLVEQLLSRGLSVRAIVRSLDRLPPAMAEHPNLDLIPASVSQASDSELADFVRDCDAVASCLGHNLTFQGLFGSPRRLVTDTTQRLCNAIMSRPTSSKPCDRPYTDRPHTGHRDTDGSELDQPKQPARFVLMNTAGNSNRDLNEPVSFAHHCVIGLLRYGLPPHADNEAAADFLRTAIGQNHSSVEWAVVRPDTLIDESEVSEYDLHTSPTRDAIFNAGKTSRINVAHLMADLIVNDAIWSRWQGQMPVIYNRE
ncbi:NAD(P)-dependent oxidoreductase [Neorhodopirellula lusitana]|nr:NAD(P)-binding oxidoreductase [Neorhodopirellula lusitana]